MIRPVPYRRKLVSLAIAAVTAAAAHTALAQEQALEEVVITGSFIKGAATDAPSPVSVIDRNELMQLGV